MISNRAVARAFEMVMSDFNFFYLMKFSNIKTALRYQKDLYLRNLKLYFKLLANLRYFFLKDIFNIVLH